jgi:hypothetical protein
MKPMVPSLTIGEKKLFEKSERKKQTRIETVELRLIFVLKFDGIRISAFPTCLTTLFDKDSIDFVSNDIKTSDVFIIKSCPIFK